MKTLSFNIIKPLAFTALFIVFAASFNTAEARHILTLCGCGGGSHCKNLSDCCHTDNDCRFGKCEQNADKDGKVCR